MPRNSGYLRGIASWLPKKLLVTFTKEFGGNAIWSALDSVAAPVSGLLMAAGFVRTLGTREYGLIVMALAISNLSSAASAAINSTTIRFVAELGNDKVSLRLANVMGASLFVIIGIDALLLLAVTLLSDQLSSAVFGRATIESDPHLGVILVLAVGAVCVQQVDGVFSAILKGLERFKRQSLVEILSRMVLVLLSVLVAAIYRDVRVVLLAYCGVCSLSAGLRLAVLKKTVGKTRLLSWPVRSDLVRLMRFGSWMWLNAAATVAFGTVDRIAVGRSSGPSVAAEYNIYMQLTQLIHFVPASLFAFTFPMFSRLGADGNSNVAAIGKVYRRYFRAAAAIGIILSLCLLMFRSLILSAFGGGVSHERHDAAFIVLVASFAVLSLAILPYSLGLGLGSARAVSLVTSGSMLASIILTICLTPKLGIEGAAAGKLVYGLGVLTLFPYARHVLASRMARSV
jgi:O-antigen/teichoic acid export membrane protein